MSTPGPRSPSPKLAVPLAAALLLTGCDVGDTEAHTPELGTVEFPTSCTPEAQPHLDRGLALLHHMMYAQAQEAFSEAARSEEGCAMAHWGSAMTRFQPLWPGEPGEDELAAGRSEALRALELATTDRERMYAEAVVAFYGDGEATAADVPYTRRLERWEGAMAELRARFPDDAEAATLHALAHLALNPADPDRQRHVTAILDEVHDTRPDHPGAIHYGIHVHDVEGRAADGVSFAQAYAAIAPSVPHALHMPSHIYVRLGQWDDVIEWNRRSADAALRAPAGEYISHHHPHALDYLMYGYLQRGDEAAARAVLEELRSRDGYQPTFISAYALAAIPARWHVERRDWQGAADLDVRTPSAFPWDGFPGAEAMTFFARGLGAARSGDVERAQAAIERLDELEGAARGAGDVYWADQVRVQRGSVVAWVALAEGREADAIDEMTRAAELAAGMEKHPVTPGALQPAGELLGDLLLEADRPDEALAAYQGSLDIWPRRYHSLLGAALAAERAGAEALALEFRARLEELAP